MKAITSRSSLLAALLPLLGVVALLVLAPLDRAWGQGSNVVVILTDDLSETVLDTALANGLMPNMQTHLIDQGVWFENSFVTNAVCCPSRATFLTGLYSHNHKVYSNIGPNPLLPGIEWPGWFPQNGNPGLNEKTVGTALDDGGLFTGHIGKYLNGYGVFAPDGTPDPALYVPPGWDDWQGLTDPSTYQVYDYQISDNGTLVTYGDLPEDYQTDVIADRSVQFIENRAVDGEQFFLVVAPLAPHVEFSDSISGGSIYQTRFQTNIRPAPRHEYLADGDFSNGEIPPIPSKPSLNEADISDKPACPRPPPSGGVVADPFCIQELDLLSPDVDIPNVQNQFRTMVASMLAVDDMIGDIVDTLDANGLLNNTVIVFTSDNGWFHGEHRLNDKSLAYEESIRVPLIIRAPGGEVGKVTNGIALNNDLLPTFADFAGVPVPFTVDGRTLKPLVVDVDRPDWNRKSFLVEHYFVPSGLQFELGTFYAMRRLEPLDILYVQWRNDPAQPNLITHHEFYNLTADPYQLNNQQLSPSISASFDQFLQFFQTCSGFLCNQLESW